MDTQHRGEQPFGERIKTADMGHLMGQNKARRLFLLPVHVCGKKDNRPEDPIGQRRFNSVGIPHLHRTAQPVLLAPGFGEGLFHRQRSGVNPASPQMKDEEYKSEQNSSPYPEQQPRGQRRNGSLAGHIPRQKQSGALPVTYRHGKISPASYCGIYAYGRRNAHRQNQTAERGSPKRQKSGLRQTVHRQRPHNNDYPYHNRTA